MLWRMLQQSWYRNIRKKSLAVITIFLAAGLVSALLAVSIDIGDKMAREMKSYGANILIEPAGQATLPSLFGEKTTRWPVRIFSTRPNYPISKTSSGAITSSVLPRC